MGYRAVIFDLDGVLCSTDEFHYLAWKALADELGIPFDRKTNRLLRGVSRMDSLEIILRRGNRTYSPEEKQRFAAKKNELYRKFLEGLTPKDVSEDVLFTLRTLRARGIATAIGSSSKNTPLILERLQIGGFDAVVDGNAIVRSKPDPEVFLKAAEKMSLAPKECLVVEDAESGVRAGIAGGFATAAIGEAAKLGIAQFTLEKLSDLLGLV